MKYQKGVSPPSGPEFTDFSGFTIEQDELQVGSDGVLSFKFSSLTPTQAYEAVEFTTQEGQKYIFDFELESFSDPNTRRIVLLGFTDSLFSRSSGDSGWWGEFEKPEGIFAAIHTACLGSEDKEQNFVYKLYAKKGGKLHTLFSSQGHDDFSWDYGRYTALSYT